MQNFSKAERIAAALYFIWFFVHLYLFSYADDSIENTEFWPFITAGKNFVSTYDLSEFLVYLGVPLILFMAYRMVYGATDYEPQTSHKHISNSFFIPFLDQKIKSEELSQKINELTHQPVSYQYLEELKNDREKAGSKGVNNWLERKEIKKKYLAIKNNTST